MSTSDEPSNPEGYVHKRYIYMVLCACITVAGAGLWKLVDVRGRDVDKLNQLLSWTQKFEGYPNSADAFMSRILSAIEQRSGSVEAKLQGLSDGMVEMRQLVGRVAALETQTAEHKRRLDAAELSAARMQDSLVSIQARMDSRFDALLKEQQISSASLKVISDGFQIFQREADKDKQRLLNLEVGVDQLRDDIPPKRK